MKWLISFLLLAVAAIGGALLAPNFIDWNQYKEQAITQVKSLAGLDVSIDGDISLAILPSPRIYLGNVKVADPLDANEVLASFEQLNVSVGLGALLNGEVEVSSVHLDQPQVRIVQRADGTFNYMTPELQAMQGGGESKGGTPPVSFDQVSVEGGHFIYSSAGQVTELKDIALNVKAGSLSGPFVGTASFDYGAQAVSAEFKTGEIDLDAMSSSLNLQAKLGNIAMNYAGVVSGGEKPSAQGEFEATLPSVAGAGQLALKGFVSADPKMAALKDAVIELAGQKMSGSGEVVFSPLSVKGAFALADVLDIDELLPASNGGQGGSPLAMTDSLPKTLELPVIGSVDVKLSVPGLVYQGQKFGASEMKLSKADKAFKAAISLSDAPGQGRVHSTLALSFAEKSHTAKTKTDIYSGPSLDAHVKGEAADFPAFVKAVSGQSGLPLIEGSKRGVFDVKGHMSASGLYLDDAVINIDDAAYSAKGSLKAQNGAKDLLKVSVVTGALDADTLMSGSGGSGASGGAIPFDVEADVTVHELKMQGQSVRGLKTSVGMKGNKITVKKFSADDLGGNKLNIDSDIVVDMGGAKPSLSGSLALGDLKWRGKQTAAQKSGAEKWSSAPLDVSWLNAFDMDFGVSARSIDYEGWMLLKPSIAVDLKNGVLNVSDLKAGLFDGQIGASGTVQPGASGGAALAGKLAVTNVNMEPLVKAMAGERIVKGSGRVSLGSDVNGSGGSMKALIGALRGQGSVSGSKIVLDGIDVQRFVRALSDEAKPGDTVLNLWKGAGTGGSTEFDTLDGAYVIEKGIVNIQKLLLEGPRAAIDTTGSINLPEWTIKTAHKMSVKDRDDIPPFTVNISGPLDDPVNTFAQGAINDYLNRKIQRKLDKVLGGKLGESLENKLGLDGVLQGVLGGGTQQEPSEPANDNAQPEGESAPPPAQKQQEITPEEAVKDILKGLF